MRQCMVCTHPWIDIYIKIMKFTNESIPFLCEKCRVLSTN